MERRLLGIALSFAHLVLLCTSVSAGLILLGELSLLFPAPGGRSSQEVEWLLFGGALLLFLSWELGVSLWSGRAIRAALRVAMDGRIAEASALLRRISDREPVLRLVGVPGWRFRQTRAVEGYAYYLGGIPREAVAIGLDEARFRGPGARVAAQVAAAAAVDCGDREIFSREELARHFRRAHRHPGQRSSQALLGAEGFAAAGALDLAFLENRVQELLAAQPGGRTGLLLRANQHLLLGELERADADFLAARGAGQPIRFQQQLVEVARAEVRRLSGDLTGAAAMARAVEGEGPRHRLARLAVIALPALAEAASGRGAAEEALGRLQGLRQEYPADPMMEARVALHSARILMALGGAERAAALLLSACQAPISSFRQEALLERGEALLTAGDPSAARPCLEEARDLCPRSRAGRKSAEWLAGASLRASG